MWVVVARLRRHTPMLPHITSTAGLPVTGLSPGRKMKPLPPQPLNMKLVGEPGLEGWWRRPDHIRDADHFLFQCSFVPQCTSTPASASEPSSGHGK